MKQYTRRDAVKLFGIGAVSVAGLGLAGCSGSNGGGNGASAGTSNDQPTPSVAFKQQGIWFQYDDSIAKDSKIERFLVFDGKGNMTAYTGYDATFSDVNGKSDEELIALAKQQDEAAFDAAKQEAVDAATEELEKQQDALDAATEDAANGYTLYFGEDITTKAKADQKEIDGVKKIYDNAIANLKAGVDANTKVVDQDDGCSYQEPQPQSFTLSIKTDDSGNQAISERLSFTAAEYSQFLEPQTLKISDSLRYIDIQHIGYDGTMYIEDPGDLSFDSNVDLDITPISTYTVYDTNLGGFTHLVTVLKKDGVTYNYDKPGADGVQVD